MTEWGKIGTGPFSYLFFRQNIITSVDVDRIRVFGLLAYLSSLFTLHGMFFIRIMPFVAVCNNNKNINKF